MKDTFDIDTFNQLFTNYRGRFIRFARSYVGDSAVAEDIALESLTDYWENRANILPGSNVPAYVLTIIRNKCLNHLQRIRTREDIEEHMKSNALWELNFRITSLEACDPEQIFSEEIQQIVDKTLKMLPEQTRDIFIRSRYNNLSHKEIASSMGISPKAVEFHITKSLKILRVALKDYFPVMIALHRIFN